MEIINVRVEHYREPFGINEDRPRISWSFGRCGGQWRQKAYEISIRRGFESDSDEESDTTATNTKSETFAAQSSQSLYVAWPSQHALESGEAAVLRVRALSAEEDVWTPWSAPLRIEAGLLKEEDWRACALIQPAVSLRQEEGAPLRPVRFRRTFEIVRWEKVRHARLYITAHGLYECFLNGSRVGDHVLAPGWTSYDHELSYQTFDVLPQLREGANAIAVDVAEGWFCGRLGFLGGRKNIWGSSVGLFAQLTIVYEDGTKTTAIATDDSWKYHNHGPLLQAGIYDGEVFDARLETHGWKESSFVENQDWDAVVPGKLNLSTLRAPESPPVRRIQTIPAQSILKSPSGKVILDFGQNLVGWVRCELSRPAGHTVRLVHAEVLEKGECATAPLRQAKCTDTVILAGEPLVYEPRFTFHGFRYVQIEGVAFDELDLNHFHAIVIHTDMARTGWFECSDPMLNKLLENVVWSMKGNFVSVPTDCPQRDERLGWTGDIQAFAPTASFLYDCGGMLRTWLRGLAHEQNDDPAAVPPLFSPNVWKGQPNTSAAIWGDSIISVPWDLYQASGDSVFLSALYPNMSDWLSRGVKRDNHGLWDPDHDQLGDWLEPGAPPDDPGNGPTDEVLVSNAFLIGMTDIMARISKILHNEGQSEQYRQQAKQLRTHFARRYIAEEGRIISDTQTAIALAIYFSLFPDVRQRDVAAARLVRLIRRNARFKIATGFAGTPILGHALNMVGQQQVFYRMLVHRKPLSWLYPITMGATTIWERWDSMLPDGSLNSANMTSFNHYALGAVAHWMHATIAGIQPLEAGWKSVRVAPVPGAALSTCRARFVGPYGELAVSWELKDGQMHLDVQVPGNTTAEIIMPGAEPRWVESGKHRFVCAAPPSDWPPLPIYPPFVPHDDDEP